MRDVPGAEPGRGEQQTEQSGGPDPGIVTAAPIPKSAETASRSTIPL